MFADGTPDRVVDALRLVLAERANRELAHVWGEDAAGVEYPAVARTVGRPIIRAGLSAERLPILSVVRRSVRFDWQGKQPARRTSFVVEYVAPGGGREHLETRWPILNAVFESIAGALDGTLAGVAVNPLVEAGVFDVVEESIRADFNFYDFPSDAFPFFQLQFDIRHTRDGLRQWHEVQAMPDLRELFARYIDARPAPEQPAVATLTRTGVGEAAALASDDPLNDAFPEDLPE